MNKREKVIKFYESVDEGDPALIIDAAARKFNVSHGYAEKIYYEPHRAVYAQQKKQDKELSKKRRVIGIGDDEPV